MRTTPPPATPAPAPTPNPDLAAGLTTHFYRDLGAGTSAVNFDLASLVTPDFLRNHRNDWGMDYAYIADPSVEVGGVTGRDVSYTVSYEYKGKSGDVYWRRSGTWHLNHGAAGWLLDRDTWSSVHLVGFTTASSAAMVPVKDRVYADGHHEFDYGGVTYAFTATNSTWQLRAVARPTPPPNFPPTGQGSNPSAGQDYVAPYVAPPPPETDCDSVSVEDVYDDGKILALDDGRKLAVADYDTATSGVWVAPFDGLICNGDRFTNTDDNESVDLEY